LSSLKKSGVSPLVRWAVWSGTHPGRALLIALAVTVILTIGASMLTMEMTFFSIMPEDSPQVRDMERITEEYPFASALVAVVDGRSLPRGESKDAVITVIDELTRTFSAPEYEDAVSGVYSTIDTEFLEDHAFMLTDTDVLDRMTRLYDDTDLVPFLTALNDDLEREYSGDGDALEDDENQVVSWVGGIGRILDGLADTLEGESPSANDVKQALDAYLIGDPYYLSRNENMGLVFINPTYTINDLGPLVNQTNRIEAAAKAVGAAHGLEVGLTGITVVGRDEMVTSEQGFAVSMLMAMLLILVLMIVIFRIRSTPLIIGIPLMLGIYWTAGVTGFIIQRLNILTAMYLVALVGLGVDYAIHIMTGFVQERDRGMSFAEALGAAFAKSGRGIITGAFTTAAAFFSMLLAQSDIIRELAVVAGSGILCELAAMLIIIPALLGLRNNRLERRGKRDPMLLRKGRIRSDFAGIFGRFIVAKPGLPVLILLIIGVAIGSRAPRVELEDNLMKMEAKGLESIKLQDLMVDEFGAAPDAMYVIINNEDLNELPGMVDRIEDLDSVKAADAVTAWWPTEGQSAERRPYLEIIRNGLEEASASAGAAPDPELLLEELYRLEANLIEMGDMAVLGGTDRAAYALNTITGLDMDGSKVAETAFDRLINLLEEAGGPGEDSVDERLAAFQSVFSPALSLRIRSMASTEEVGLEDLPNQIRDTFLSRDGQSTLLTIMPRQNPWEGRYRNIFTAQVETVTDRGTGMILAADQMIAIAETDSVRSMVAALIAVFLILIVDFRNLRLTILTFSAPALVLCHPLGTHGDLRH
jgi:predicted RND superfamily exporter protein